MADGLGKLGGVPHATVVVGDHGPETAQRFRRNGNAELRQVALEERAREVLSPQRRGVVVHGEIAAWKAPALPEQTPVRLPIAAVRRPRLGEVEAGHAHQTKPAGQGLRCRLGQCRGRAAEEQKPRRSRLAVEQNAQRLEKLRLTLDFVDHNQAGKRCQRLFRSGQPTPIDGPFKVEEGRLRLVRGD